MDHRNLCSDRKQIILLHLRIRSYAPRPAKMSIALLPLDSPPIAVERRFGVVYPKMERLTGKGAQIALLGGILTLRNLGTILHKSSRIYLFQQALCFNYYQIHDATQITTDYHVNEALCKVPSIQASLSTVDGIDSFLQCLPRKLLQSSAKCHMERAVNVKSSHPRSHEGLLIEKYPDNSSPCAWNI